MAFTITATGEVDRSGYLIDGVRYPRVTSVTGVLAKPGLARWRERLIGEGSNPDVVSRTAAAHGTAIHKLTERADRGETYECPEEYLPHLVAYLKWKAEFVKSVEKVEERVVNRTDHYAGTLDRVVILQSGERVLLDLKTGASVDGVYRLQQSAYQDALRDQGDDGIDRRCIVHLPYSRPGEISHWVYDDDERDLAAWKAALVLYRFNRAVKDEWKRT